MGAEEDILFESRASLQTVLGSIETLIHVLGQEDDCSFRNILALMVFVKTKIAAQKYRKNDCLRRTKRWYNVCRFILVQNICLVVMNRSPFSLSLLYHDA